MRKGTYKYDKEFIQDYYSIIELKNNNSSLILIPDLQGRVITSTCQGDDGFSFGWINYDFIKQGKLNKQFNPFGGEERFWIGPEGGQFSIFFKNGDEFDIKNWVVPSAIDTDKYKIDFSNNKKAVFSQKINLTNYSGTNFIAKVKRTISLISIDEAVDNLGLDLSKVSCVIYRSDNELLNLGNNSWDKETGLLSIWMSSMMISSPDVTVIIPIKQGEEKDLGIPVNDNYFRKIPKERLIVKDNVVFFKADGNMRGKIGISPKRVTRFMGSYDSINKSLTILECFLPEEPTEYVNSSWQLQEKPYNGDVLNAYNDGPLEDGSQMGPFYELESSSPALDLKPNESKTHTQQIYHFIGQEEELTQISEKLLGVSINEIKNIFK